MRRLTRGTWATPARLRRSVVTCSTEAEKNRSPRNFWQKTVNVSNRPRRIHLMILPMSSNPDYSAIAVFVTISLFDIWCTRSAFAFGLCIERLKFRPFDCNHCPCFCPISRHDRDDAGGIQRKLGSDTEIMMCPNTLIVIRGAAASPILRRHTVNTVILWPTYVVSYPLYNLSVNRYHNANV